MRVEFATRHPSIPCEVQRDFSAYSLICCGVDLGPIADREKHRLPDTTQVNDAAKALTDLIGSVSQLLEKLQRDRSMRYAHYRYLGHVTDPALAVMTASRDADREIRRRFSCSIATSS
jgi:hypothetical protein